MWGTVLRVGLVVLALGVSGSVGFLLARRWRREYKQAVANRNEYHALKAAQAAQTTSSASASVSGHVVVVQGGARDDDDGHDLAVRVLSLLRDAGSVAPGVSVADVAGAIRSGDHRWDSGWDAALDDDSRVPQRVGGGRAALGSGGDARSLDVDAGCGDVGSVRDAFGGAVGGDGC